jgi:hypothetical protein
MEFWWKCNLVFTSLVYDTLKNHSQVDVIYTDFKNAFNSVNHKLLIYVLRASGFGELLLSWVSSYFSERYCTQYLLHVVKVFGVNS